MSMCGIPNCKLCEEILRSPATATFYDAGLSSGVLDWQNSNGLTTLLPVQDTGGTQQVNYGDAEIIENYKNNSKVPQQMVMS